MADKTYEVNTPIVHNGKAIEAGALVEFNDKHAAPLLECGAIAEQKPAEKAVKAK